jgi:hypothetical protein
MNDNNAAEVDVELIEAQDGWTPYLSLEDARNWTKSTPRCVGETSGRQDGASSSPPLWHDDGTLRGKEYVGVF